MELPSFKIVLIALGVVFLILIVELVILFRKSPQAIPLVGEKLAPQIEVVSDLENFSVKLTDKKKLNKYIDEFGLFKKEGIKIRGTTGYQTIEGVVIHLTGTSGQDFFDEHLDKSGKLYYSVGAELRNGKLHLLVFIEPSLYEQKGQEEFARQFSISAVRGVFLTSRTSYEMNEKEKEAKGIALNQEISGSNSLLFIIKKTK